MYESQYPQVWLKNNHPKADLLSTNSIHKLSSIFYLLSMRVSDIWASSWHGFLYDDLLKLFINKPSTTKRQQCYLKLHLKISKLNKKHQGPTNSIIKKVISMGSDIYPIETASIRAFQRYNSFIYTPHCISTVLTIWDLPWVSTPTLKTLRLSFHYYYYDYFCYYYYIWDLMISLL